MNERILQGKDKPCGRTTFHRVGVTFFLLLALFVVTSCGSGSQSAQRPGAIPREETVTLPTKAATPEPTPVSTRVLPLEALTPPPTSTITPIPGETLGLVVDIIDGDTIAVVLDGDPAKKAYQVRYLGIEAPPASDPWGTVAYETNRKLTQLKIVRLERDQTNFDAEGYLLRHVYLNNQLVSVTLVEQGLARAAIEEPNTGFEEEILEAEARARAEQLGIWGQQLPTPTATSARQVLTTPVEIIETPTAATPAATGASPTEEVESTEEPTQVVTVTSTPTDTPEPTSEPTEEGTPGTDLGGP